MRSRYRIHRPEVAHFVTGTVIEWLPVFTTAARCDIPVDALLYCREHKALRIYAWVILDNHFHAILAAPDLSRTSWPTSSATPQRRSLRS
jgi:putative transposase